MASNSSLLAKYNLIVLIIVCISLTSFDAFTQSNTAFKKNSIYAELSSRASVYTINYDRIFSTRKKTMWSYRAGFSVEADGISMPLGISLLTGKKDHHAEFSLTLIPYVDHYKKLFMAGNMSDKYLYIMPALGYRYQRPQGGVFLKAAISPMVFLDPPSVGFWNMDPKYYIGFMVGAGYSF